jgi:hypothetical protein
LLHRLAVIGYPLVAGLLVLLVARTFYAAMLAQTGGEWSAPLDDVFIHFDFARATARGYPFQWSEGNGYSSGNTSLSYPFVLALGYWVGFRGPALMLWAAIVACCSVFGLLLVAKRLARALPALARYLLPVAVLSVGALDWSLFSGMEVAWFLAVWSVGLSLCLDHRTANAPGLPALGWKLGLAGAAIVATRPEGATSVFVLGCAAALLVQKRGRTLWTAVGTLLRAGVPAVILLLAQASANKLLTGSSAAAGALVKLAYYDPYMSPGEKWDAYLFHLAYALRRNIEYHFADAPAYGCIPVALAAFALLSRRTRGAALLLLASAVSFLLLVAMNGQVRWQNERYTMPAVAWLLLAAGLGTGALLSRGRTFALHRASWIPRIVLAVVAITLFAFHQAPKMRDQLWFFARASRNIRDQHTTAGRLIRSQFRPAPRRILVGDAGAILYAADLPGLDIIGLGGFKGLPFARASSFGLGASIELLERVPRRELPDVMALYPTWWGKLPIWFGHHLVSVWVEGNVICGGLEKAIYAADWHMLGTGAFPATRSAAERILDEVDVADVLSEDSHQYAFPSPNAGFVDLRILSSPVDHSKDLLDAGRRIPADRDESFVLRPARAVDRARLVFRTLPSTTGRIEVRLDERQIGSVPLQDGSGWVELSLSIPLPLEAGRNYSVTLTPRDVHGWTNFHVWLLAAP